MNRPILGLLAALSALVLLAGPAAAQSNLANCKYYTKTQQDFEQGFKYCKDCIEDEPENPEARYYGAWCLAEMGMYKEAWESFDWLISQQDSKNKKLRKHAKWAAERAQGYFATHFNKGVEYLKAEDYFSANEEFAKATQIYPTKAAGFLNYGFTQNRIGDADGAIESFRKAVEIAPDDPTGYEYLAVALQNRLDALRADSNADPAERTATETELQGTLTKVLENDPSNDAALLQLADLELAKGNRDLAFDYIEKSVDIDPENLNKLYNMGVGFYEAENWDAAIEAFGKTAELLDDPDDQLWLDAMYNKAICERSAERWDDCIATLDALLEVNPDGMDYHSLAGQVWMKKGDKDKALVHFQKFEALEKAQIEGNTP
jgi:tetratricopeptide (TPR) repeat protein